MSTSANGSGNCCNKEPVVCERKNNFNAVIIIVLYILLAIIIGSCLVY